MLTDEQKETVRHHLKKVLASSEFARSDRAAAFLTFIVTNTLNQDSNSLRERAIGIAVFERAEDWDPKLDTTVRTEARRLRKKLSEYYASPAGEDQSVCIDVPLGAYVPKFRFLGTGSYRLPEAVSTPETPAVSDPEPHRNQTGIGTTDSGVKGYSRRPVLSHPVLIIFSVAATFAILVLLVSLHYRKSASPPPFRIIPLTAEYGNEISPTISPDSRQIAYVWDGGTANYRIYVRSVNGGSSRRLTSGNSTELSPFFSPDGKQIGKHQQTCQD